MQLFSRFKSHGTLDRIFKLAHVARPLVPAERIQGIRVYPQNISTRCGSIFLQEMIYQ